MHGSPPYCNRGGAHQDSFEMCNWRNQAVAQVTFSPVVNECKRGCFNNNRLLGASRLQLALRRNLVYDTVTERPPFCGDAINLAVRAQCQFAERPASGVAGKQVQIGVYPAVVAVNHLIKSSLVP